jgi:hypothetical protein
MKYTNELRSEHAEQSLQKARWRGIIELHFSRLQDCLDSCGLDSSSAALLACKDPTPTRDDGTFVYLQYRVALAYANAISTLHLMQDRTDDPWFMQSIVQLLQTLEGDAMCHTDELVEYCADWWGA